jgi:nitrous oxidase accessory protein
MQRMDKMKHKRPKAWFFRKSLASRPLATLLLLAILGGLASHAQTSGFDLAQALAEAGDGDTIVIPAGIYDGPLSVDKSVRLIGDGWPIIDGAGEGDVLTVTVPDVTIQGLVLRNSGASLNGENAGITGLAPGIIVQGNRLENVLFGVYLKNAPKSVVRDNVIGGQDLDIARRGDAIRLWYCAGSLIDGNHASNGRDVVIWFSPNSIIKRNIVEYGRYGLHFMYSDDEIIEENVLRHNSVGAFLMYSRRLTVRRNLFYNNRGPSGYGLALKDMDDVLAEGNRFISNRRGLYLDNSPRSFNATGIVRGNLFAYNDVGVGLLALVTRNSFTQNIFHENGTQVSTDGRRELKGNVWNVGGLGNYWSDYAGYDADRDGVGDVPYRSQSRFENLMDEYPELRLFQLSPVADAIDLATRAFPLFQSRPKMNDDRPLMEPPPLPPVPGLSSLAQLPAILSALGLLLLGGLVVAAGLLGDLLWNRSSM